MRSLDFRLLFSTFLDVPAPPLSVVCSSKLLLLFVANFSWNTLLASINWDLKQIKKNVSVLAVKIFKARTKNQLAVQIIPVILLPCLGTTHFGLPSCLQLRPELLDLILRALPGLKDNYILIVYEPVRTSQSHLLNYDHSKTYDLPTCISRSIFPTHRFDLWSPEMLSSLMKNFPEKRRTNTLW